MTKLKRFSIQVVIYMIIYYVPLIPLQFIHSDIKSTYSVWANIYMSVLVLGLFMCWAHVAWLFMEWVMKKFTRTHETIHSMTNCPTCGSQVDIGGDGATHYYIPRN